MFVDTAAWVGLLNTRDELHEAAQRQIGELRRQNAQLITTEFVLLELANMFSAPVWRQRVVKFIRSALLAESSNYFRRFRVA